MHGNCIQRCLIYVSKVIFLKFIKFRYYNYANDEWCSLEIYFSLLPCWWFTSRKRLALYILIIMALYILINMALYSRKRLALFSLVYIYTYKIYVFKLFLFFNKVSDPRGRIIKQVFFFLKLKIKLKYLMSDVWCLMSGVWCLVSGVWCLMFDVWYLIFD